MSPARIEEEPVTTDLSAEDIEDDLGATGSARAPGSPRETETKLVDAPPKPAPRMRPPVPAPRQSTAPAADASVSRPALPRPSSIPSAAASASIAASSSGSTSGPPRVARTTPPPPLARPALAPAPTPRPRPVEPKVEIRNDGGAVAAIAPSESMVRAAERPLATQPGTTVAHVQRAKSTAMEVSAHVAAMRKRGKTSDVARLGRLLVEEALASERADELPRAQKLFQEALDTGVALLPAVRGARRVLRDAPLAARLALLDREAAIVTKENERADLMVERARILEAEKKDDLGAIIAAYQSALALRPLHAEALKGLEAALVRARSRALKDTKLDPNAELAEQCARLASAYGSDPELVSAYYATRARLLEQRGDLVAAEEAYAAALSADGRVGPVREAYKRLLARRKAWSKLRDVLAEEAGREHDMPRSVRLLHEAARISCERLGEASQAIQLLEHAASRAPTDASVDARVLDELTRLYEGRGDARGAAVARRALLNHEEDAVVRTVGYRKLATDFEAIGDLDSAIGALAVALSLEPLHLSTQLVLDRLYAARGLHGERLRLWLDEAAKAKEPQRRAQAYVRAAHVAEDSLGRPDDAREWLQAAWVTDTSNIDALDELTRLLLPPTEMRHGVGGGEGRSARALIELFTQAAHSTREPARRIAYLEKVASLWEDALGNPGEAAKVYEKILSYDTKRRFTLLALQRAYERSGDFRALAQAIEVEADQATDAQHAAALRLRAAETWSKRAGDADRAIALVKKVLETQGDNPTALRALLAAHEGAARWEEVARTLERMLKTATGDAAIGLWLELAEVRRRRLGKLDDAIEAWRAIVAIEKTHPVATRELAWALRTRDSYKEVALLEEAIAASSTHPDAVSRAWVRAAEVWEGRLDDDERAQAAYAQALAARPQDLSAWEGLARLAERRNALDELAAAYRLRIEREEAEGAPKLATRLALGELLARRGDEGAAAVLERVVHDVTGHVASLRLLETIYRRNGNDVALARTLTSLAQAARDPLAKRGILWDLVRLQERTDEGVAASPPLAAYLLIYELDASDEAALTSIVRLALERLRQSIHGGEDVSDKMPNVRGLLAFGYRKMVALATDPPTRASLEMRLADLLEDSVDAREQTEALALYRDALTFDPESPTAVGGVRRVAARLGDLPAQLAAETRAAEIALDRSTKVGHLLRAAGIAPRVAPPEGGDEIALELLVKALHEDPDSADAATATSGAFLARGDARRLVDVLMEAASNAKRPERIVALAREGAHHASATLGNVPVAIAMLSQARAADETDATLLVELGDLYVQQRTWAEAARAYQEAATAAREDAIHAVQVRAHRALAALFEGPLEDPEKALAELKLVCGLAPDDFDAQRRLAKTLRGRGDLDGALTALDRLASAKGLPLREQVDVLGQAAELRQQKGDFGGAEQALRRGVRLDPDPSAEAFARFSAFHQRNGGDGALAAALGEMITATDADPRWLRTLGDIEVHRIGRPTEGVAHLRQAVQAALEGRGDLSATQLSYGEALLAVGAVDDAAKTLREILARDPSHAGALDAAQRALSALGRRDEAQSIEEVRAYFGHVPSAAALRARRLPATPPRPQALEDVAIHAHVMPPAARATAYEVLHAVADQLSKVYAPDLAGLGLGSRDKLSARSGHPLRAIADRAAQALGVAEYDFYIHDAKEQRILVENTEPPAIVVPRSLETLPELEIAFSLSRLVAKIATRTWLVDKLPPHELEELLHAAVEPFGGPLLKGRSADVEDLSRRVQKAISRRTRRQLEELAPRFTAIDVGRFARAIDQGTVRTAYLLTGDVTSAVDHLRRMDPKALADLGPESRVGELLRFAVSPDSAAFRRRLGTTWT